MLRGAFPAQNYISQQPFGVSRGGLGGRGEAHAPSSAPPGLGAAPPNWFRLAEPAASGAVDAVLAPRLLPRCGGVRCGLARVSAMIRQELSTSYQEVQSSGGGSKVSRGAQERGPAVWAAEGGRPGRLSELSEECGGGGVPACGGASEQEGSGAQSLLRMLPARDGAGAPEP